jgi:hypothetical protein
LEQGVAPFFMSVRLRLALCITPTTYMTVDKT